MASTRGIERHDWVVCGLALACAASAVLGSQHAFLVACLGIPFALIWLVRIAFVQRTRPMTPRLLGGACALVLLVAGPASCTLHVSSLERRMQEIIIALDAHRQKTGTYPKRLLELVPPPNARCDRSSTRQVSYHTRNGDTEFSLTCVTFGMNKHTFDSVTRKWTDWD
ncbi:MAG: hypothetical protein JNK75_15090 [Betaproteobacteria bacterium]|nr:hypothetical protein [Betaproteobacteria bacterium]